jgi:hypothetical protein
VNFEKAIPRRIPEAISLRDKTIKDNHIKTATTRLVWPSSKTCRVQIRQKKRDKSNNPSRLKRFLPMHLRMIQTKKTPRAIFTKNQIRVALIQGNTESGASNRKIGTDAGTI